MGLRIKKNDTVLVLTGKDKGKKGRVLKVIPSKQALLIEGINIAKKHMKPNRQYTQGGIIEKEMPLHISKAMLICPKCNKPTRISASSADPDTKSRMCKKCKEVLD